jgi:pimeloyl-ACP methyl ester carboxylesterase
MEERTAETTAGGSKLSWRELGTGEPLLLINGYAGAKADWDPIFLERLGSHSRVICTDSRGIGDSELGDEEITVELLAADVLAVMDAIGIEQAPVAGWSMGGFVAQTLGAFNGERVEALVLLSTDPGGELSTSTTREHFLRLIDRSGTPREQASRLISLLFPDPPAAAIDEQFGELVAAAQAALDPAALEAQVALMASWHRQPSSERLDAIRTPVLAAHGAEDVVIPAVNSETIAARIPGAWKAIFPGAGHAFMAMEPVRLAALIGAFLGR